MTLATHFDGLMRASLSRLRAGLRLVVLSLLLHPSLAEATDVPAASPSIIDTTGSGSTRFASPPPDAPPADIDFERIPIPLSNNSISSIFQDHQGFLWFGTYEGLNQWDGVHVTTYKHDPLDSTSLADNWVRQVVEDGEQRLWVNSGRDLQILDRSAGRFETVASEPLPADSSIFRLHLRTSGEILVTTGTSVYEYDDQGGVLRRMWRRPPGRDGPHVVLAGKGDTLMVSDHGGNLYRVVPRTGWSVLMDSLGRGDKLSGLLRTANGELWARTANGVGTIDEGTGRYRLRASFPGQTNWGSDLVEDDEGRIWCYNADQGIALIDASRKLRQIRVDDPSANPLASSVQVLYADRTGSIWAGTLGGVYRYHPRNRRFHFVGNQGLRGAPLSSPAVVAIYEDPDSTGVLWSGAIEGGLDRIDLRTGEVRNFSLSGSPDGSTVWTIREDDRENLWLAWGKGLVRFDRRSGQTAYFQRRSATLYPSGDVTSPMVNDGAGGFWLGTEAGSLLHFDSRTLVFKEHLGIGQRSISALHRDARGLWIGTTSNGLERYDPKSGNLVKYRHGRGGLAGRFVWAIHPSDDGVLWFGTTLGLSRFDPATETFVNYLERDGLPGAVVYSILEDDDGRLWVGTNHGLARFDPATEVFEKFGQEDGLGNIEFNRRAAFRGADGAMYFGGTNGITWFRPEEITKNTYRPPVVLTAIHAAGREHADEYLPYGRAGIELQPGTSTFSFEYAALDYFNPTNTRYRYRLDGFDEDWVDAGTRRYASYTNIPPGRYAFRVIGANGDGVWNEEGALITVSLLPYFWQTTWFHVVLMAAFAAFFYGAYRYRVAQLLAMERLRLRIAGDLHDDIGSNLSSIALISDVVARRSRLTDRERKQLAAVGRTARETTEALREIVWLTRPGHDDLDDLLVRMEDTAATLLNGCSHSFHRLGGGDGANLPMWYRRNVFLIYKELLHNAARHSGAEHVIILVRIDEGYLELVVMDDGAGFDASASDSAFESGRFDPAKTDGNGAFNNGSGLGLESVRRRAAEIGGRITFESDRGKGTAVTLRAALPAPWYGEYRRRGMQLARTVAKLLPGSTPPARRSPQSAEHSEAHV